MKVRIGISFAHGGKATLDGQDRARTTPAGPS
jgi:hypothetical protein